jgi:methylglyoxal synthase
MIFLMMKERKRIALVAHDNCKKDLIEWTEWNWEMLVKHQLVCTGTTGQLIEEAIMKKTGKEKPPQIIKLKSGPLGGDQQLGAMISDRRIDIMFFFWDPMQPHPHDVDVKALLRISVLYNIPTACNRATADFLISSSLLNEEYTPIVNDFISYSNRDIPSL